MKTASQLLIDSNVFLRKAMKLPLDSSPHGQAGLMFDDLKDDKPSAPESFLAPPQKQFGYIVEGLEQIKSDIVDFNMMNQTANVPSAYKRSIKTLEDAITKAVPLVRKAEHSSSDLQELQFVDSVMFHCFKMFRGAGWQMNDLEGFEDLQKSLYYFGETFHQYVETKLPYPSQKNEWYNLLVDKSQ